MFLQSEPRMRNSAMSQSAIMSGVVVSSRPLQNINCILQPEAEKGALFLGDVVSTLKESVLEANCIKAILTCMAQNHNLTRSAIAHKTIPIKDTLQYPISLHFDEAAHWIESKRKQGLNVLVHCHAGVSRSATIVTAYLMRFKGWTANQALNFVRSKRERAKPNLNFWNQLSLYEQKLLQNKLEQSNLNGSSSQIESKLVQVSYEKQSPTRQYRKRRIFQTPPIQQRNKIVVSTECLAPSSQKYSQSIIFNTSQLHPNDFQQNKSTLHSRAMSGSIQVAQSRVFTPQNNWRPQINLSQPPQQTRNSQYYPNPPTVSPFELGNLKTR